MRCIPFALGLAMLLAVCGPTWAVDEVIDSMMYSDPEIPMGKRVVTFQKGLADRWAEALGRPDADTRTQAATAIALGKKRGVPGLETAIPALKRELDRDEQHPVVRLAVAKALVSLDAKDVAPRLHALAATASAELVEVITPALAAWDYRPARADWRAKVDSADTRHRSTLLAIRALATVKEEAAADRLRELALSSDASAPVRLEAARALSELRPSGQEAEARKLAEPTSRKVIDRLVAVTLLRRHTGDQAVTVLQTFVRDPEPSVAAIALGRLVELDPKHVLPVLTVAAESSDANVRALGVTVLDRVPGDGPLAKLADFTNDPHPAIRVQARKALHRLAGGGQLADVVREGMRILAGSNWRGQEQAAILLAQLDHKAAVPRLVEILSVDRGETMVAAAWAVRKLDVADSLPAVLAYSRSLATSLKDRGLVAGRKAVQPEDMDAHLCQLIQFLGKHRHRPSEPLLRELVPPTFRGSPTPAGAESRSAAVWALGKMHEGVVNTALSRLFIGRLNANNPGDVEDNRVRAMCAIALGRMKDKSAVETLRKYFVDTRPALDRVNNSCGWALEQITGEKMEAPAVVEAFDLDWFLKPVK
jgi:HEAT repeat protein